MEDVLSVLIISDGKLGHENQSLGLAEAIARLRKTETHRLQIDLTKKILNRVFESLAHTQSLPKPHIVIATGHRTHLCALFISKKYRAACVSLMKPSLPLSCFFRCICPEHDFLNRDIPKNVILSKGALNRVRPKEGLRSEKFLLIGGPSKTHGWDEVALLAEIKEKIGNEKWIIADSRRSPEGFLETIQRTFPQVEIFPHQHAPTGWLSEKISSADQVLVTEDSVSMIYEALSSGANVGILPMPRVKNQSRIILAIEALKEEGYFHPDRKLPTLSEADRCAAILLADYEKRRR